MPLAANNVLALSPGAVSRDRRFDDGSEEVAGTGDDDRFTRVGGEGSDILGRTE